jgi:hypothetical protein
VEGYALGVIAGAGGDHAALAFSFTQREEFVEGAALFKGSRSLKVFQLQMNGQAGEFRKMMRELARGDVNGVFDASARGLNADKRYGFQDKLLVEEKVTGNAKPPAALAGGGLSVAGLVDPVRQAFPARLMWLLIRMAGMGAIADSAEKMTAQPTIAKRMTLCMALNAVEQRCGGGVKRRQSLAIRMRRTLAAHSFAQ